MLLRKYIKNYFEKIEPEKWSYTSFYSHLRILGYDNNDCILRNYKRSLKEIIKDKNRDNEKKKMAENLLGYIENDELTMVNIPIFIS